MVSLFPHGEREDVASLFHDGRHLGDILASYTAPSDSRGTAENIAKQFIFDLHLSHEKESTIISGGKKYSIVVVTIT